MAKAVGVLMGMQRKLMVTSLLVIQTIRASVPSALRFLLPNPESGSLAEPT
jgi:hypothetical protein